MRGSQPFSTEKGRGRRWLVAALCFSRLSDSYSNIWLSIFYWYRLIRLICHMYIYFYLRWPRIHHGEQTGLKQPLPSLCNFSWSWTQSSTPLLPTVVGLKVSVTTLISLYVLPFWKECKIVGVLRLPSAGKKTPQSLNTFSFQPTLSPEALLAIATDRVVTSEKLNTS